MKANIAQMMELVSTWPTASQASFRVAFRGFCQASGDPWQSMRRAYNEQAAADYKRRADELEARGLSPLMADARIKAEDQAAAELAGEDAP
ncbi:MAG: hypothetical protein NTY46_03040 [Candidatus Sumerlaeota bacterium]|nr:hypothetical protein [Candidatus Sumerlaeota bacterium]